MLRIKILFALAATACVCAAVATPGFAFAKEFQTKAAPINLKGINKGSHVFETGGLGTVECGTVESGGKVTFEKETHVKMQMKYTGCFLKALGGFIKGSAKVKAAKYNILADGIVENEAEILIEAKNGNETCKVKIPTAGNNDLILDSFSNIVGTVVEVETTAEITNITQVTEGGGNCGRSSKEGKYKGISIEKAEKGSVAAF